MMGNNWPNLIPTVDVEGLYNVYSAPVDDCKIPTLVQCWGIIDPTLSRLWKE